MRFIIYKNSVLATICSLFGSAFIAMAVMALFNQELDIPTGIIVIAIGAALFWLGSFISARKERKKQARSQSTPSGAAYTSTRPAAVPSAQGSGTVKVGMPVKASIVWAGLFFLLATAFALWASYTYSMQSWHYTLEFGPSLEYMMYVLLMIGCFRTRRTQEVSVLHLIGFAGIIVSNLLIFLQFYRANGFGGYGIDILTHNAMVFLPICKIAACFLMTLITIFALKNVKAQLGGCARALWIFPVLLLALAFVKCLMDGPLPYMVLAMLESGLILAPRAESIDVLSLLFMLLAMFFTGFAYQRICKKTAAAPVQPEYARPEPQYAAPAAPAQDTYSQYNSAPQYASAEPPKQPVQPEPAQTGGNDIEKMRRAYKDLLDCGILSQEEYNQKIRELTRG